MFVHLDLGASKRPLFEPQRRHWSYPLLVDSEASFNGMAVLWHHINCCHYTDSFHLLFHNVWIRPYHKQHISKALH